MTGEAFNNSNFKSLNVMKGNKFKSKRSQVGFTVTRVEPKFPDEYEPFNVYFQFQNTGNVESENFTIRMVTECLDDSSLGVDKEDQIISSLKPGETEEITLTFKHGMFAGNYVINAYLDNYNKINDQNKDVICRSTSCNVEVG